jgi:hypothetical protein
LCIVVAYAGRIVWSRRQLVERGSVSMITTGDDGALADPAMAESAERRAGDRRAGDPRAG